MGIDIQQARFLFHARDHGVRYGRVGVLGRQMLMASKAELEEWLDTEQDGGSTAARAAVPGMARGFAEPFLEFLGAKTIVSFDASDYESATVVHDFNEPIPERFDGQFDTVVDSGSLEHIFNFPVAIKNLMRMVRPGGHLLIMTPANNFCGHGFYQFSPELFYRLMSEANGFAVRRMLLAESFADAYWWKVPDPAAVRRRVSFENRYWTHLYLIAQRLADKPILAEPPQQSDYAAAWENAAAKDGPETAAPPSPGTTAGETQRLGRGQKIARSLRYRWLKYTKFRGKDRELMMKGDLFRRTDGP